MRELTDFSQAVSRMGVLGASHAYILKYRIITKFLLAGGLGAVIMLSSLVILTEIFGLWYLTSTIIAFILATSVSFTLHKFWTFRDRNVSVVRSQASTFFLVQGFLFVLNIAGMYFLVDIVGLWYLLSQIFVSGALAVLSFFVYRFKIFIHSDYKRIIQPSTRVHEHE